MTCTPIPGGYVCQPTMGRLQRQHGECWGQCEADSDIVMAVGSPYYGPQYHCVACGDSWCDDGMYGRPFRRGWRQEALTRHARLWDLACECPVKYDNELYAKACKKHQK